MKKNFNYYYLSVFLFFLYAPTILFFFFKDNSSINNENRNLSSKPELSFKNILNYPKQYDDYYNDNLPFRNNIINNLRNLHFILFKESIDDRVVIGKNEKNETWLFYDSIIDHDDLSCIDGRREVDNDLIDELSNKMKEQTKKLKDKGIDLYYIVGPNKSTIYSNYLPKSIVVKDDYFSKVNDILKNKDVNNLYYSIDLLKDSSKEYETYYRTDTHWNQYGSYIYLKEILKEIYNDDVLKYDKLDSKFINSFGKDLHNFLGVSFSIKDNDINIKYENDKIEEEKINDDLGNYTIYQNDEYVKDETVLLIGDSFTEGIVKHIVQIYKNVIWIHTNNMSYSEEVLDKYDISKIFYVVVERKTPNNLFIDFIEN